MAITKKFTWGDFLKKNPEFKKKQIKRTSSEGEKAYLAAFKEFAKGHLKDLQEKVKKQKTTATASKKELVDGLKKVDGKKWHIKAKTLNKKIGRFDAHLARLEKDGERFAKHSKEI